MIFKKQFPHFKQHNTSDCGPTCLRMIAKHYRQDYSVEMLRRQCHIARNGVNMLGISDAATHIELDNVGVKMTFRQLAEEGVFPCILHWNRNHFVVCYGIDRNRMTTMYWVWKNRHQSRLVGFCHYRRRFTHQMDLEKGEYQVMEVIRFPFTVSQHYKDAHNYNDYYDIIDILNEKYGEGNPYTDYLLHSKTFIPFCSFIMHWEDFEALCEFFFPILFEFDRRHGLGMSAEKYWAKAERDFRHDDKTYQARAMSFLAERLISCYMVCHMEAVCVKALKTKLGYYD